MSKRKSGPLFFKAPKKPVERSTGREYTIAIERLSDEGRGLGFHEGRAVFAAGALPGEQVRVRALSEKRTVVEAQLLEVLQPAPQRQTPPCALFGPCGGCQLQMLSYADQVAHKQQILERLLAPFSPRHWDEPLLAEPWSYRHRARLAVADHGGKPQLGFKSAHSHRVVAVPACPVLEGRLQPLLQSLPLWLAQLRQWQRLQEVIIAVDADGRLALDYRAQPPLAAADRELLARLAVEAGVAVGEAAQLAYAVPSEDLRFAFTPQDFTQVNPTINDQLVNRTMEWLAPRPDDTVADFFCGLGNFSFALARRARRVIGFEIAGGMVHRAQGQAAALGFDRLEFAAADLFAPRPDIPAGLDRAVLDPPRAGALALCRQLAHTPLCALVYVSCNPATLVRDLEALVEGGLRVERAALVDMFPQTGHSEAMVLLTRQQ